MSLYSRSRCSSQSSQDDLEDLPTTGSRQAVPPPSLSGSLSRRSRLSSSLSEPLTLNRLGSSSLKTSALRQPGLQRGGNLWTPSNAILGGGDLNPSSDAGMSSGVALRGYRTLPSIGTGSSVASASGATERSYGTRPRVRIIPISRPVLPAISDGDSVLASDLQTLSLRNSASDVRDSELHRETAGTSGDHLCGRTTTSPARDARRSGGSCGIRNIGNTCFMNAVLQCLCNIHSLHGYILQHRFLGDVSSSKLSKKGALIKAFAELMNDMWMSSDTSSARGLDAKNIKSQVEKFAPRFIGRDQQDAQEFLRYLLEGLHQDVNMARPQSSTTKSGHETEKTSGADEMWQKFLQADNSKFVDIFVGQLMSTLTCTVCSHTSVTFDPFWDLSLPIPLPTSSNPVAGVDDMVSLAECFDQFTEQEVLDTNDKPICSRCRQRQTSIKSLLLHRLPAVLVIHLKRFSSDARFRSKIGSTVTFPHDNLDLSRYSSQRSSFKYNLIGVVNHQGTAMSGHYTAYCRHPYSGDWRLFDDAVVKTGVSSRSLVSDRAYVLFYERQPAPGESHL